MTSQKVHHLSDIIHRRLLETPSFREYSSAFRLATGLPMRLVTADPNSWNLDQSSDNQSKFCQAVNLCNDTSDACIKVNQKIMQMSSTNGTTSCLCFAGLRATSIAVFAGSMVVGYLKTGQVFQKSPTEEGFEATIKKITESKSFTPAQLKALHKSYFETITVTPERYSSIVTLLEHFAHELSTQSEKLAIAANEQEPEPISRARKHIHSQLDETISLPQVARIAGMSESHFCRQFKMATGMTLTEYVNYTRILWAKNELLKPNARISEIAFHVGFQSLSQFNRCFAKFHGGSPSQYRDETSANSKKQAG